MMATRGTAAGLLLLASTTASAAPVEAAESVALEQMDLSRYDRGRGLETTGQAVQGIGFACLLFGGTFAAVGTLEQDPGFSSAGEVLTQISFASLAVGTPLLSAGALTTSRGLRGAGFRSSAVPASLSVAGAALTSAGLVGVAGRQVDTTEEWVSTGVLLLGVFINQSLVSLQNRQDRPFHQQIHRHRLGQRVGSLHYGPMLSREAAGLVVAGRF